MVKVYVKNPEQVPSGMQLHEGKRGGKYYETKPKMSYEDLENLHDDNPEDDGFREKPPEKGKIKIITKESKEFLHLIDIAGDLLEIKSYDVQQPTQEYLSNLIRTNNIKIPDGVNVNILPCNMDDAFGFIVPGELGTIYIASTPDEEIYEFIYNTQIDLKENNFTNDEIKDITIDGKRAATIIHEIGHSKVFKFVGTDSRMEVFKKLMPYVRYLNKYYVSDLNTIYREINEILAEDYRQIVGGPQAALPNRYLYPFDTVNSEMYKYKKGRLDVLRKMGVF